MQDFFVIDDEETLDILANQQRLQILELLATRAYHAQELTAFLDVPNDDIDYHLRVMLVYELITYDEVADTYRATARRYVLSDTLHENVNPSLKLALEVLDRTRLEMIQNPRALLDPNVHEFRAEFGKATLHLTPPEARELADELNALWERFANRDRRPGTAPYSLLLLFFETSVSDEDTRKT
jgi:DNA-binding transcriptional ArsR family regulator